MTDPKDKTTPTVPLEKELQEIMKLVTMFTLLGAALSFLFGRAPGTLPDDIIKELAPSIVVVCGFLISYEFCDVMGVGMAKGRKGILEQSYKDLPAKEDEEVYLRQRVLTNQLEQMPLFIVGTFLCALLVNGKVASILSLVWVVLRRMYASTYKRAGGKKLKQIGLAKFTVPCYFICNTMVMAAGIQAVRGYVR
uniref:Uncharacterized protein n=1 Tax=Skeletonema marinoi TaxID=267567 RepID=A0A7S2M703_9STRA|mmetsp:Transcript_5957/g.9949  ORF Transcript_5957/g.9949 Transcript_5957/m.9949 type:complete len:194 (+) Transcript_5957:87-668(+)